MYKCFALSLPLSGNAYVAGTSAANALPKLNSNEMIFSIYIDDDVANVDVYDSLVDFSYRVDWQDLIDSDCILIDENGNIFNWDDTKNEEIATTFGYSFKIIRQNIELGRLCFDAFESNGRVYSFNIKMK